MSGLLVALPKVGRKSRKKPEVKGIQPITKFLSKLSDENDRSPKKNAPVPVEPLQNSQDVINVPSDFSDCSMNDSVSDVINDIISRKPELEKLGEKNLFYEDSNPRLKQSLKKLTSPKTSTPKTSVKNYQLDDTLLQRIKRKSYQEQLKKVNLNNSFDDFFINYQYSEPVGPGLGDADPCEQSFFFEPLNNGSKHDIFEESLNKIIGTSHKIGKSTSNDSFDEDSDDDLKENRILISD